MKRREQSRFWDSTGAATGFAASILFLISFRAPWAFQVNFQNDEGCYLANLGRAVFLDTSGICERANYFAPAASWFWLPAGLLGRLFGALGRSDPYLWIIPCVAIYSFSLFFGAIYVLGRWLEKVPATSELSPRRRVALSLLLLNAPILYYMIQWAMMPHTAEIVTGIFAMACIASRAWGLAIAACLVLTGTRYNDFFVFLVLLGALWDGASPESRRIRSVALALSAAVALGIAWIAFVHGYGGLRVQDLFFNLRWSTFREYLLSDRRGLLWLEPCWLGLLGLGLCKFRSLSWAARGALAWMFFESLICVLWEGNGGGFGYRYAIGAHAGAVFLVLELLKQAQARWRKALVAVAAAGAVWMTYLTFAYRSIGPLSPEGIFDKQGNLVEMNGVPEFFVRAIQYGVRREMFEGAINQQFPWVVLLHSLNRSDDPRFRLLNLQGPPLLILTLAVFLTSVFAALYFYHWVASVRAARSASSEWRAGEPGGTMERLDGSHL